MVASDNKWDQRTLCSDGNCIGLIGADGRCKACGLPYTGESPTSVVDSDMADEGDMDDSPADQPDTAEDDRGGDDPFVRSPTADDSWENRTLCIDESCIGVVGPDGRCKVCGKPNPG